MSIVTSSPFSLHFHLKLTTTTTTTPSVSDTAFQFFQAVCVLTTSYTGVSIRHSDWSRYSKTPAAARLGACIACPLFVAIAAIFGIFVTSATRDLYGVLLWNPMSMLGHIQSVDYSATTRAGTFFAGLGWFLSQIAVRLSLTHLKHISHGEMF